MSLRKRLTARSIGEAVCRHVAWFEYSRAWQDRELYRRMDEIRMMLDTLRDALIVEGKWTCRKHMSANGGYRCYLFDFFLPKRRTNRQHTGSLVEEPAIQKAVEVLSPRLTGHAISSS
jgi:hypothetical protein